MTDNALARVRAALLAPPGATSDFDLNPETVSPDARKLRPAGVLVPIIDVQGELRVILTKRSSALKHHPGQIAFPGGSQDAGDADATAAALREAHEEIGLDPALVNVLGVMPVHETVTGFRMTPVIGRVTASFDPVPEAGEVEEVFDVPLAHLMDPGNYRIESRFWRGARRRYYVVPFGPYYIWGATARVLRAVAEVAYRP